MLFSIQVFGLFPVFRRYIKHLSWSLHVILTVSLVFGAAGGLGYAVGWGWAVMYIFTVIAGMGGCGWWMIDLQKYKKCVSSAGLFRFVWLTSTARYMGRGILLALFYGGSGNDWRFALLYSLCTNLYPND